ncbi:MAG: cell division protein FtsQ/DivIB [Fidelibacterota bacterium]
MNKKKKQMNWRLMIGTMLTSMLIVLSWLSINWSAYTKFNLVKNIFIQGANIIPENEYYASLSSLVGVSIDEIDIREVGMLLESHPFVQAARVSRTFPNTLQVEIAEREPIALLNMRPILYVDNKGVVLPELGYVGDKIIPIMSGFNSARELYPIGHQTVSLKVLESVSVIDQIMEYFPSLYNNLSEITLNSNDEFVLILSDYPTRVILGKERLLDKIQILTSFSESLPDNRGLNQFKLLDLRYNRQVIAKVRA